MSSAAKGYLQAEQVCSRSMISSSEGGSSDDTNANDECKGATVYWFRDSSLRLHDNPSLLFACETSTSMMPIYVIDERAPFAQTRGHRAGVARANFCLSSLHNLGDKLKNVLSTRLLVFCGVPEKIIPSILSSIGASRLIYERETSNRPVCEGDDRVVEAIRGHSSCGVGVDITVFDSHTLFGMDAYVSRYSKRQAPSSYGAFRKIFEKMGPVPLEVDPITRAPLLPANYASSLAGALKESDVDKRFRNFEIPDLRLIGYSDEEIRNHVPVFPGGEDEGLARLSKITGRNQWVLAFDKPKTIPTALECDTTGLSPYIKHGCISPRRVYHSISKICSSQGPTCLLGQLIWREFEHLTSYITPNFDRMVGNPAARQIPWDFNRTYIEKWKNARTGYPYIDAIMTELRLTGWIHHLARQAVAVFFTRGDLWQNWQEGALIFEELLVDADWSVNNYNWQWTSCTAHCNKYSRCYSPISSGKKTDKNGDYIQKWLPQFRTFPDRYIYEPWTAPKSVQSASGLVIGVDYPTPIVDHRMINQVNMNKMKEAFDAHKNGEPPVIDDIWKRHRDEGNDPQGICESNNSSAVTKRAKYEE